MVGGGGGGGGGGVGGWKYYEEKHYKNYKCHTSFKIFTFSCEYAELQLYMKTFVSQHTSSKMLHLAVI